jgi:hypothetical protein
MTTELPENASDTLLFIIGALEDRLAYLYFVRSRGHAVADQELSDLRTEIFSLNPKSDALNVFFELRARLAFLGLEENKQAIKALLYDLNNISARMWQEPNHQRPHFQVNYKSEHNASYAVDTLERLAGEMPRKFEKEILDWAAGNQQNLLATWRSLQAGEDVRGLVTE